MPDVQDPQAGGMAKPNAGFSRFDQHTASDKPIGPEPEEPATPEKAISGE